MEGRMLPEPTLTLADQLFWIVDCFCKTVAAEACKRRVGALGVAVWNRVRRFERRFCSLYGMWRAGTLPVGRKGAGAGAYPPPRPSPSRGEGEGDAMHKRPASLLPRAFAWLYRA